MPTANATLPDGTKVTIEGTADEIAAVLQRLSERPDAPTAGSETSSRQRGRAPMGTASATRKAKGPADYIRELIADDFFKTKRGLSDVQKKLEEGAHIYPVTHLSPSLFRLVRAKELRRIKEDGTWKYVNP
jgi:hypothetical protein